MKINSISNQSFGKLYRNIYVKFNPKNIYNEAVSNLVSSDTNNIYIDENEDKFDVHVKTPKEEMHFDNNEFHSVAEAFIFALEKLYPAEIKKAIKKIEKED